MPLEDGVLDLDPEFYDAYIKQRDAGKKSGCDPDKIISDLAQDMADAIHKYMEAAKVITMHTVQPGQSAIATGPVPGAGPGTYTSPGQGSGEHDANGALSFPTNKQLKADIEQALQKEKQAGSKAGANSDAIIEQKAQDIANAIHDFAFTGIINLIFDVHAGVTVMGYLSPPPATAPVPSISQDHPSGGTAVGDIQG